MNTLYQTSRKKLKIVPHQVVVHAAGGCEEKGKFKMKMKMNLDTQLQADTNMNNLEKIALLQSLRLRIFYQSTFKKYSAVSNGLQNKVATPFWT